VTSNRRRNSLLSLAILQCRGARTTAIMDFIALFFSAIEYGNGVPSISRKIEHYALHKNFSHAFVMSSANISG
jgi:hypothetical protein